MALTKKLQTAFSGLKAEIAKSAEGFIFAAREDVAAFVAEGLVEINEAMTDEAGRIACRIVEAADTLSEKVEAVAGGFKIESGVEMPPLERKGAGRSEKYPFSQLEIGQSFFVPATDKMPDPVKSLASTVSGANKRYAEAVPGEFVTGKNGKETPKLVHTRRFTVRPVEGGARVWRVEV